MLFNPLRTLSIGLCKLLFNRLKIPSNVFTLSLTLFTTVIPLVSSVGVVPVIRALFTLNRIIRRNGDLGLLRVLYGDRLNPYVLTTLTNVIGPLMQGCYKVPNFPTIYSWLILPMLSISCIRPIFRYGIKFSFGLLLSSVGILWDESLSAISTLNSVASYFIDLLESYTSLKIPRLKNLPSLNDTKLMDAESSWLFIMGLFFLSLLGLIGFLFTLDYVSPDTVQRIPYADLTLNSITSCWYSIEAFFFS